MSTLETLDVGQALELKLAFRKAGWSNGDLKRLCEGRLLVDFRDVLLGHAEVRAVGRVLPDVEPCDKPLKKKARAKVAVAQHIIDCDADPFIPEGWSVGEHRKGGKFLWSPSSINLFLADGQKNDKCIGGDDLRAILKNKKVLNANVLDFLLAHPQIIPEAWKGKNVFFWGTIYRVRDGGFYVRVLCWGGSRWYWNFGWLCSDWCGPTPAAVAV